MSEQSVVTLIQVVPWLLVSCGLTSLLHAAACWIHERTRREFKQINADFED